MDAHLICKEPRIGFEMSLGEARVLRMLISEANLKNDYKTANDFIELLASVIERAEQNAT